MIDVIIPTYKRAGLIKKVLPYYLTQKKVASIIIVEDGPLSPSIAALARETPNPRVITISTGHQSGAAAAKLLGIKHASSKYVAFGEDDAFPEHNYYAHLASHIEKKEINIAAGSINYLSEIDEEWLNAKISTVVNTPSFGANSQSSGLFQGAATHALYVAPRELLLRYPPDPNYAGNGWREETDPLLSMWTDGYKIAIDPKAVFHHLPKDFQKASGQHVHSRMRYEYLCIINDIRFFKKHKESLIKLQFAQNALIFSLAQASRRWIKKITARLKTNTVTESIKIPRPGIDK